MSEIRHKNRGSASLSGYARASLTLLSFPASQDGGEQTDAAAAEDNLPTGVEDLAISQGENTTDAGAEKVPLYCDMIIVNATSPSEYF
jgi:hypothetical protein